MLLAAFGYPPPNILPLLLDPLPRLLFPATNSPPLLSRAHAHHLLEAKLHS
jgi:hypothetical protein